MANDNNIKKKELYRICGSKIDWENNAGEHDEENIMRKSFKNKTPVHSLIPSRRFAMLVTALNRSLTRNCVGNLKQDTFKPHIRNRMLIFKSRAS